jgi:hypothetical protein
LFDHNLPALEHLQMCGAGGGAGARGEIALIGQYSSSFDYAFFVFQR